MLKVGFTHRRRNMSILETVGSQRELMAIARRRQMVVLGHIVRANGQKILVLH